MTDAAWLPHLVGSTSIWKRAADLNEPKLFDGRLLVPETEGSESLPVTVRWDLTGLLPLKEAREKHPAEVIAAVDDFQAALERAAKSFSTPNGAFEKYKDAFTVPALEANGGANYFYSPSKKKLFVINWGASPRSMGGESANVYGFEEWGKHWRDQRTAAAVGAVASAGSTAAAAANPLEPARDDGGTKQPNKSGRTRPWWLWPLLGLVVIALVLSVLFLKACDDQQPITAAGPDASVDALVTADAETAAAEAGADGATTTDGGGDAGADAAGTAAVGDGGIDAASADGGNDSGTDAGADGGLAIDGDDDDHDFPLETNGTSGTDAGGRTLIVKIGPGGGQKTSVHRTHYSDEAQHWRISAGAHKVSRTEEQGRRFEVWLSPGQTFEGVRIEWQDKNGTWHVH